MTHEAALSLDDVFGADWPVGLPDHFSATQATMERRCPEQYRQRYVLGVREAPASALLWGGADHAAIAHNLSQKIESHVDLPVDEVQDAFVDALDTKIDAEGGPSEIVWEESYADVKDKGTALVALYHDLVSPDLQPVKVEGDFSLDLPGVPIPVVGFVDVETEAHVIERKTSKRREKAPKAQWQLQGKLYQIATAKPVEWHLSVKSKPTIVTPAVEPGLGYDFSDIGIASAKRQIAQSTARVAYYMTRFGPDTPWPDATDHPWACGYCGYRPECPWWAK